MITKTTIFASILIVLLSGNNLKAQTAIPDYHDQTEFLLAPSGAYENGLLGFANPAILTTLHGADAWFFFSDEGGRWDGFKRWGFFSALPHFGFGMIRHRLNVEEGGMSREIRITDYRISFSGGSAGLSLGLGYGWSTGDLDDVSRDGLWTAGILTRPSRYFSIGLTGNKAQHRKDMQGILDVALRPLGTDRLTLFSDFALQSGQSFKEGRWSIGTAIQPVDGIFITGRYFDTRAFTLGFIIL
jgi:protease-4